MISNGIESFDFAGWAALSSASPNGLYLDGRHRLFADHVKRTRSTIWMKKDGDGFIPVPKHK